MQFPCTSVLFSVVYRPPDAPRAFYDLIAEALEKAWLKTTNIVLLGDFNCDFLCSTDADGATQPVLGTKAACLQSVFDSFNMYNVISEATRVTLSSCTLIDLIVTTRKHLITFSGVFPLGISDHSLIHATMNLKKKRPPPKCITVRDYKKLDLDVFRYDLATAPFHVASVFDDADDIQWAWQNLFDNICNHHAPWKQVKIRSTSAPWISDEIRYKMNRRYKLFKKAVNTKCPILWQEYKRARNEVTSALRIAKANYFSNMFDEVKNTTMYWKLLKKATNPTRAKIIGPLKREDDSLALLDEEKAALMNSYFSPIREKLADKLPPHPPVIDRREPGVIHNLSAVPPPK